MHADSGCQVDQIMQIQQWKAHSASCMQILDASWIKSCILWIAGPVDFYFIPPVPVRRCYGTYCFSGSCTKFTYSCSARQFWDLKFTYCFCAHMHEIVKYFILTENQEQCLNPVHATRSGPSRHTMYCISDTMYRARSTGSVHFQLSAPFTADSEPAASTAVLLGS